MNLGFIGTGTIATAVVHALAPLDHSIIVSERSTKNAAALSAAYTNVTTGNNADITHTCDVIFLGLLPEHAPDALKALPFRADQRIISFIADLPLSEVAALTTPAKAETLLLPFPAIAKARSPLIAFPQSKLADEIFAQHDVFSMSNQAEFDALLRAQAVLSPVVQMLTEASQWAARNGADQAKSESFLRALIASNLTAESLTPLLQSLSTEGGYNARLNAHQNNAGTYKALVEGLAQL
ncbi:NAD(P)-binding domain-containing protein [Lentibacter algarum]|uniref:NAD(P)-binding domain-containing protein n=1 Tax=Lentibacter algarum TaxID=576131 RepID=UPI001C069E1B|nr:NAD(P)-binding domain-containing protein [Lentibacter algarum]MBU2981367.1 NAD(P)-binding domain-containing protein [Lentibacter algarum]